LSVRTKDQRKELALFADVSNPTCSIAPTKVEVTLTKVEPLIWPRLEQQLEQERKKRDWNKIHFDDHDDDEEDTRKQTADGFLRELYENAPEDVRRAMIKSYVS
jgi:hypothetical protein